MKRKTRTSWVTVLNRIGGRAFSPAVVVVLVYVGLLFLFGILYHYQAMSFVHLGTVWGKHDPNGTWGYDGQFYYQIAIHPFEAAEFMDNAPYRYQRIVYPMAARLLALGKPNLVPYTLLLLNWLSIAISVELLSSLLRARGLSPWFSLGYGLYFGQATALTFDTTEPFTYLIVCTGVWLWSRKKLNWAALLFGVASVSRETAVLFPLGYAVYFLLRREWKKVVLLTGVSVMPLLVWLAALRVIFGETGITFTPPFEHIPFYGILFHFQKPRMFWLLIMLMLVPTAGAWILACLELWKRQNHPLLFAWIANIAMITFMARTSYMELISCSRVAIGLVLAGLAYGISTNNKLLLKASQYYALTFLIYLSGVFLGIDSLIL